MKENVTTCPARRGSRTALDFTPSIGLPNSLLHKLKKRRVLLRVLVSIDLPADLNFLTFHSAFQNHTLFKGTSKVIEFGRELRFLEKTQGIENLTFFSWISKYKFWIGGFQNILFERGKSKSEGLHHELIFLRFLFGIPKFQLFLQESETQDFGIGCQNPNFLLGFEKPEVSLWLWVFLMVYIVNYFRGRVAGQTATFLHGRGAKMREASE